MAPGDHGSTYGGNTFVCAAVKTVFDIMENDHILYHVQDVSAYLIQQLDQLVEDYDVLESRRGLGLMLGLVFKEEVKPYIKELLDDGVIVVSAGANILRMLPPLVITKEHVDLFINKLKKVLG